ncbi:MAG TPA: OmpA family protein [Chitinophagaceae bacterium]|nr:OmpA family protein [Chitinophagaceae bacterium]
MASKKFTLLAGLLFLLTSAAFSQMGSSYDVKDSSVIPAKRMPQHTEFLNGTYNYPAKPRNQWELGVKGGLSTVSGDVRSWLPTFGGGLHVRKAFGYIFSARVEYDYLTAKGLNFSASQGYGRNPVLRAIYGTGTTPIYYNYKTAMQELSLQGVFTLNNIRFHKAKTGINFYGFGGFGAMIYNTKYNALNGNTPYDYSSIVSADYKNRKATLKALKRLLDGSFETKAETDKLQPKLFGQPFKPALVLGFGTQIKLSDRLNIAIEDKFTSVKTDLLDGQQWQENYTGDPQGIAQSRDFDSYNFLSVGLNINIGSKSVQPLWWLNPLDYAYSEIRNPRLMRLPKPVLPDSDGDGVTDQFDQEQTPQGCPVDTHGVSRDTDGDGVPDCKDKELVTPTYCQPVDADGIGKCPCPDSTCFANYIKKGSDCAATLGALPSVNFKEGSVKISDDAKSLLATVGSRMRNNPDCKVVVVGYCSSNKRQQQLSWDRVNAIINYLVEKEGVSADRFIFQYGQEGGDCNTVDIRAAAQGEEGPNTVPAPHPNLRKNK